MILLGSTGSIGTATLDIARRFSLPVETLVAGNNAALLQQQIDEFQPKRVVIGTAEGAAKLRHPNVRHGETAILEAIEESQSPIVLNALVGFLGLKPTLKAIECGKKVALANKESLVAAGKFVDVSKIHPVDSEHFGLWYLQNNRPIDRLILTASGGALRDFPLETIENASLGDVLKHPNWAMGSKITIDSATMVNKLFEVLEARWLFGDHAIDAVIERGSIVHALIGFKDGCTTAQLSRADMRLPIAHALLERVEEPIADPVDLLNLTALRFEPIDPRRYPIWALKEPLLKTPELGVVINAANEAAMTRYLAKEVSFGGMARLMLAAFERFQSVPANLDDVFALNSEVRNWCEKAKQ